tara:strand:- start:68 stop:625 length:558 start_codon:yes stop_codon:yes gene_type:complete
MQRKSLPTVLAVVSIFGLGFVALPGAAAAESQSPKEEFTYCSIDLDTDAKVCAASADVLADAVLRQTSTALYDGRKALVSEAAAKDAARASYVVGQVFSYPSYGGSMLQFTRSSDCASLASGTVWAHADLATVGFNNDIDSFKSFSGCSTKVFENTYYGGSSYGWATNATSIGVMANQASSIQWH